jgi:hypothetical protein
LKEYEIDPFLCESRAYCRLKARGLCEKGHIPDFYGLIHNIDLKTDGWESHLQPFSGEPELPNAVVIEFIPNLRPFELSTYSPERADQLKATLIEMHELGVLHGDLERRNVKVQEERNRALWIDFDRAVIFPLDSRTEREEQNMRKWVAEEQALLSQTLVELVSPHYLSVDRTRLIVFLGRRPQTRQDLVVLVLALWLVRAVWLDRGGHSC